MMRLLMNNHTHTREREGRRGLSALCLRPPPVHPHPGGAADLLPPGPGLRGVPADGGAAREAGVLHGHPEDPAVRPGGAVRGQEPQTHAEKVSGGAGVCGLLFIV